MSITPIFVVALAAHIPVSAQCDTAISLISCNAAFDSPVLSRLPPKYSSTPSCCVFTSDSAQPYVCTIVFACLASSSRPLFTNTNRRNLDVDSCSPIIAQKAETTLAFRCSSAGVCAYDSRSSAYAVSVTAYPRFALP